MMANKIRDITGERFGGLVAVGPTRNRTRSGEVLWLCLCDCGNECEVASSYLTKGDTRSCGCTNNIAGERFGRLVAVEPTSNRLHGGVVWLCLCDCGAVAYVTRHSLIGEGTKSCGCIRSEVASDRASSFVGDMNPNWNPSLTDDERAIKRQWAGYAKWRRLVLKRDDHTCQRCGARDCEHAAHHIENYADNPELRTSVENGATLCVACHIGFHRAYGYRFNTVGQYREWRDSHERGEL